MIKIFITLAVLVGCAHKATQGVGTDAPAASGDAHGSGSGSGSDGGSSAYVCTPPSNIIGSCCVFGSACGSGSGCYYDYAADNAGNTSPNQGAGYCGTPIETPLPLGAACDVNAVPGYMEHLCGVGAWCAYDANTGLQNNNAGICRQLCDPLDQAAHGCSSGTCVGMEFCSNAGTRNWMMQWPNCPSATNTHLGYCVP
jgi:hypothetical protein